MQGLRSKQSTFTSSPASNGSSVPSEDTTKQQLASTRHASIHLLIHSFIHPLIHTLISFILPIAHLFIHQFTRSSILQQLLTRAGLQALQKCQGETWKPHPTRELTAQQSTVGRQEGSFREEEILAQVLKRELVLRRPRDQPEQRCGGGKGPGVTG